MDDLAYWLGFSLISGVGPARFRRLLQYFGSAESAWRASFAELSVAGLDARTVASVVAARQRLDPKSELERVHRDGVGLVSLNDESYPPLLKQLNDAPIILYVRGSLRASDELAIGVVGTRKMSPYGRQACERLVAEVAGRGITIVSGLARGIDSVAHRAALRAGGRTIAVIGSGVDVIYPPEHRALAAEIADNGAIISEYALGAAPEAGNFPQRNRIISGMSRAVLVVEAGVESGALITANFALEQGRDVLAIPGSIFSPGCEGTNRLIQQGAKLVQTVDDVLEEIDVVSAGRQLELRMQIPTDPTERSLMEALSGEPTHIDEIVRRLDLPVATVSSALALLELKGLARQVGGMSYVSVGRWG